VIRRTGGAAVSAERMIRNILSPSTLSELHLSFASMDESTLIFKILCIKENI
jgi:hypothetical protein